MAKKNKAEKNIRRKKRKAKEHGRSKSTVASKLLNDQAPLHGCWVNRDWKTAGFAYLVITRKMTTGLLMFASFWLDPIKGIIEDCHVTVNITEETFQRKVLNRDPNIDFFNISLDLAKEILAPIIKKIDDMESEFPDQYGQCLKLVGPIDSNTLPPPVDEPKDVTRFYYDLAIDFERVDAELRQIPDLEEDEDSTPDRRAFEWTLSQRIGWFGRQSRGGDSAKLILQSDLLILEVSEKKQADNFNRSLLQYLGTTIVPKE